MSLAPTSHPEFPLFESDAEACRLLDPETYARFARPALGTWLAAVGLEWLTVAGVIYVCNELPNPLVWILGILIIGTRQHGLGIMAHEGCHHLITRNSRLNDWLANLLAAYPLGYPVQGYRTFHLLHHSYLDTPLDAERASIDLYPREWTFPMSKLRWYLLLLRDATGVYQKPILSLLRYIWQVPGGNWKQILLILLYQAVVATVAFTTGYGLSYLLLWLLPLYTVAVMCFRIRTVAEHSGIYPLERRFVRETMNTVATTRTTVGWVGAHLFAPYNMAYHVEHHLFPTVPVFRLRALHRHLMEIPAYKARAVVTYGYPRLFQELTGSGHRAVTVAPSGVAETR